MAPTLIKPPPPSSHLSLMESSLQLTPLRPFGPSIFTNTRPLWHPPNARGIFGGAAVAQSLLAAYKTIPSPEYIVHSMHCYFVLAGDSQNPVMYHVERVRDGHGFVTRTVQARQAGKVIFTTTVSFMRRGAGGKKQIQHAVGLPVGVEATCPADLKRPQYTPLEKAVAEANGDQIGGRSPFEAWRFPVLTRSSENDTALPIDERRTRSWLRVRGRISDPTATSTIPFANQTENGDTLDRHVLHVCALAYMSDSYFIGSISRVHGIARFSSEDVIQRIIKASGAPSEEVRGTVEPYVQEMIELEKREHAAATAANHVRSSGGREGSIQASEDNTESAQIGMMVSLDHTIYFHNPENFRADDWMFSEMKSPWTGDGRGLVMQNIWTRDGILIATCVQEGVVRLKQDGKEKSKGKL